MIHWAIIHPMQRAGIERKKFSLFLGWKKGYNSPVAKGEMGDRTAVQKTLDGDKMMKKALVVLAFLFLATPLWAADVGFNITIGAPGFYLSVGNFFGYPEREVIVIHQRGIPDNDLPVVFFISRHAHVAPEVIIDLRVRRGWSWSRICAYYRIPPAVFYIPVDRYGPPYGHGYGHYRRYPHRRDWDRIRLTDAIIINQVNLIFISKYYDYPPERVIRMRELGSSFGTIERRVYREREYQARRGVPSQEMHKPGTTQGMHIHAAQIVLARVPYGTIMNETCWDIQFSSSYWREPRWTRTAPQWSGRVISSRRTQPRARFWWQSQLLYVPLYGSCSSTGFTP